MNELEPREGGDNALPAAPHLLQRVKEDFHGPLVAAITLLIQLRTHILSASRKVPMTGMLRPHGGVAPGVGSFV